MATQDFQRAILRPDWPVSPTIHAVTTLRHGAGISRAPFDTFNLGTRCGDESMAVAANRQALMEGLALPAAPYWLHQVHGCGVVRCVAVAGEEEPQADAAVTSLAGRVLAILTADCLPVVFSARQGGEIAAAHAGWRGLAGGVLEATLAAMQTPPEHVSIWLGPAAGPRAYEVDAVVRDAFMCQAAEADSAFAPSRPGYWYADLYRLARQRLIAAGVEADAIFGGGVCTITDSDRFFSHRRDRCSGRMATLIWMDRGSA